MAAPTGPIQLIGTIENPLTGPFNGAFILQLNTYGSVLPSAAGGKYIGIPPNLVTRVPVVNGQVQLSPPIMVYGNDAMQGNTWYIVKQVDNNGNVLSTMNAAILGDTPYDLGSIQPYMTNGLPSYLALAQLTGQPGLSAYQEAVTNGFSGTETEWLATLVGPPGTAGVASLEQLAGVRVAAPLGAVNLLDPTQGGGGYIDTGSGALVADGDLATSGFVVANSGGEMTTSSIVNSGVAGVTFYDQSKTFLSGVSLSNVTSDTFSVPSTAAFVRVTYSVTDLSTVMLVNGTTLPSTYQGFNYYPSNVIDSKLAGVPTGPSVGNYTEALISNVVNIFNPAAATTGEALHPDGSTVGGLSGAYLITNYMSVVPGGSVIASDVTTDNGNPTYGWAFYDLGKNYISGAPGTAANTPVAVPATAVYARTSFGDGTTNFAGVQICASSSLVPSFATQVETVTATQRPYVGKKWMRFGDSISTLFNPGYEAIPIAELGFTTPYQDSRGGRTTQFIFENYSNNPVSGVGLGGDFSIGGSPAAPQPTGPAGWAPAGNTLAQDLAEIDVVTVYLGTNDSVLSSNLGSLGDASNQSGSYYAILRYAIEGFQNAKPGLQLIWIGPYFNDDSGGNTSIIAAAQQNICSAYGIPYLNLYELSGVNGLTLAAFTGGDNIHPNQTGLNMIGRLCASIILNGGPAGPSVGLMKTLIADVAGGSVSFSSLESGTSAATLVVGSGGSLAPSGSGTITATSAATATSATTASQLNGGVVPVSAQIVGTNGAGQITDNTAGVLAALAKLASNNTFTGNNSFNNLQYFNVAGAAAGTAAFFVVPSDDSPTTKAFYGANHANSSFTWWVNSDGSAQYSRSLIVENDDTTIAGSIFVQGKTNPNQQLRIGYRTDISAGYLQATTIGATFDALVLNPEGGAVEVGSGGLTSPNIAQVLYSQIFNGVSADIANTTMTTSVAGMYRLSAYFRMSTPATAGALTVYGAWHDVDGSVVWNLVSGADMTTQSVTTSVINFAAVAGQPIQFQTVSVGATGSYAYTLGVTLEYIGPVA